MVVKTRVPVDFQPAQWVVHLNLFGPLDGENFVTCHWPRHVVPRATGPSALTPLQLTPEISWGTTLPCIWRMRGGDDPELLQMLALRRDLLLRTSADHYILSTIIHIRWSMCESLLGISKQQFNHYAWIILILSRMHTAHIDYYQSFIASSSNTRCWSISWDNSWSFTNIFQPHINPY